MIEVGAQATFVAAFVAGLFTFLAPCTLPLVPAYLGFISGSSVTDLADTSKARTARKKIFINSLFYVAGFTLVFVAFGVLAGFLGQALAPFRLWFTRLAGILIIGFGLFMLNILRIPYLGREHSVQKHGALRRGGTPMSSLGLGAAFAFGWTPCVGPVLATILALSSTSGTVVQGGALLLVFSAGLAIPFLLIALGIGSASGMIGAYTRFILRTRVRVAIVAIFGFFFGFLLNIFAGTPLLGLWNPIELVGPAFYLFPVISTVVFAYIGTISAMDPISMLGGVLLVFLGVLLLTNNFTALISYGYQLFRFINYDGLYEFF